MSERHSADEVRQLLAVGRSNPAQFRAALASVPPGSRDGWLDRVFGLGELPEDGPDLPPGCVPYLPCPAETLMRVVELADVRSNDVFVDVGSGLEAEARQEVLGVAGRDRAGVALLHEKVHQARADQAVDLEDRDP